MKQDEKLDETLDETFPASDPPANTVETGIARSADVVTDNVQAGRFEIVRDGQVAFLKYDRQPDALVLIHTEAPPALRGHRIGEVLVKAAIDAAHRDRLRIIAICPFVRAYLRKHP